TARRVDIDVDGEGEGEDEDEDEDEDESKGGRDAPQAKQAKPRCIDDDDDDDDDDDGKKSTHTRRTLPSDGGCSTPPSPPPLHGTPRHNELLSNPLRPVSSSLLSLLLRRGCVTDCPDNDAGCSACHANERCRLITQTCQTCAYTVCELIGGDGRDDDGDGGKSGPGVGTIVGAVVGGVAAVAVVAKSAQEQTQAQHVPGGQPDKAQSESHPERHIEPGMPKRLAYGGDADRDKQDQPPSAEQAGGDGHQTVPRHIEPGMPKRLAYEDRGDASDTKHASTYNAAATTPAGTDQFCIGLPPFCELVQTTLADLPADKKQLIMQAMLLLCLNGGRFASYSETMMFYLVFSLGVPLDDFIEYEINVACKLMESAKHMTAEKQTEARMQDSKVSKKWKVGLASAAGAAVVGVTGGLAAPAVAAGLGTLLGGLGIGAGYLGALAGSSVLVGGLFGAYGGRMTGSMMKRYAAEVEDFTFLPVHEDYVEAQRRESMKEHAAAQAGGDEQAAHSVELEHKQLDRRLRVTICVSGWLTEEQDFVDPWRVVGTDSEVFALRWEFEALLRLGKSLWSLVQSGAWTAGTKLAAKNTVFGPIIGAVLWPTNILRLGALVDNPFNIAKRRADKAGEILADALIDRAQGERPVVLVGFSLGARVVHACLASLARRGAFGLVESAVLMGAPVGCDPADWARMRAVVSGRLVNVYSRRDAVLKFLFRAASLQFGLAGLEPVDKVSGVENYDFTDLVAGHLKYKDVVGMVLEAIGVSHLDGEFLDREKEAYREEREAEERDMEKWTQDLSLEEKEEAQNVQRADEAMVAKKPGGEGGGSPQQQEEEHPDVTAMREKIEHETAQQQQRRRSSLGGS
ncbi:hypothetical protein KEM52_000146, partial [Ascosphaera acerosa]